MALRIRRGTDAERQSITPKLGELLYVTDTGKIFVGDGTTQGGNLVSVDLIDQSSPSLGGNLDLNSNDIVGIGNINIDGTITATGSINLGDGAEDNIIVGGVIESSLIPKSDGLYDLGDNLSSWRNGFFEGLSVDGEISTNTLSVNDIYSSDSTPIYNSSTQTFEGNLNGSLIGNDSTLIIDNDTSNADLNIITSNEITANSILATNIEGNFTGSLFGDDSTLILDTENRTLRIDRIANDFVEFISDTELPSQTMIRVKGLDDKGYVKLTKSSENDLTLDSSTHGQLQFERDDPINGSVATGLVAASNNKMFIASDPTGIFTTDADYIVLTNQKLGVGIIDPTETLDVAGTGKFTGYVQFGSLSTVERNVLTPANGMVIYNTTNNRFEGYQNGEWINLDDGTTAA